MKIAVFSDNYFPEVNGLVTTLLNQFRVFGSEGHDVLVFTPRQKSHVAIPHVRHIQSQSFPSLVYPNMRVGFPSPGVVWKRFDAERPDIVHIHTPFLMGYAGIRAARKLGVPVVGTYHTKLDDFVELVSLFGLTGLAGGRQAGMAFRKRLSWLWTNAVYGRCDAVTCPTVTMDTILKEKGLARRTVVISNGVDLGLFHSKTDFSPRLRVIHFGRISPEKNIDVLIRAMPYIRQDVMMDIAGDGPDLKRLKKMVGHMRVEKRIRFLGAFTRATLAYLLRNYDVFLTASDMETQGLAALEAAASGLPIICVDKLAVQELVEDNGFVVKTGDHRAMAECVNVLYENPGLIEKMGRRSRQIAEMHDVESTARQLLGLYEQLALQNRHARRSMGVR
jgi:glycosyltransferase involved in cell wall biosynthesis